MRDLFRRKNQLPVREKGNGTGDNHPIPHLAPNFQKRLTGRLWYQLGLSIYRLNQYIKSTKRRRSFPDEKRVLTISTNNLKTCFSL